MNEQILLSKYALFPKHELRAMGLLPIVDLRRNLKNDRHKNRKDN